MLHDSILSTVKNEISNNKVVVKSYNIYIEQNPVFIRLQIEGVNY